MTTGPDDPYGQPPPPYQPPAPPPPSQQQPPYGQPSYGQPSYPPYGTPGYPVPGYTPTPPNEGMAVAAMVVGIVALVLSCGYGVGLLGSPVALVLGRVSMKRIDASGGQVGGRGMAQAGFILGIIGTILLVLAIIVLVIIIIAAVNGAFDDCYSSYNSSC
jgi:hypothetical protein